MQELSAEECLTCKEALKSLLGKVYQPIVIKELLILQGGPKQVSIMPGTAGIKSDNSGLVKSWPFPFKLNSSKHQLLQSRKQQMLFFSLTFLISPLHVLK